MTVQIEEDCDGAIILAAKDGLSLEENCCDENIAGYCLKARHQLAESIEDQLEAIERVK